MPWQNFKDVMSDKHDLKYVTIFISQQVKYHILVLWNGVQPCYYTVS